MTTLHDKGGVGSPAGGPTRAPLVQATNLIKTFGPTKAVRDVSFAVGERETRALLGRNGAGKSTLVSMLTGLTRADSGSIRFGGELAPNYEDRNAWRKHIACVYQKPTVVPELTVAENIFLNRQPGRRGVVSWKQLAAQTEELLEQWDIRVRPRDHMSSLTVEQRKLVEIARALSEGTRLVILDEPTAQLERPAVGRLFDRLRVMQDSGISFIYISHYLEEIYEICDTVTVMRDGRDVLTSAIADAPRPRVVEAMVGSDAKESSTDPWQGADRTISDEVALECRGVQAGSSVIDASFTVRRGEWVGVTGLSGSGRVTIANAIMGLEKVHAGTIDFAGKPITTARSGAIWQAGIGLVPEDRYSQGFAPLMSIEDNISLPAQDLLGKGGWVSPRKRRTQSQQLVGELSLKCASTAQPISDLSGGNQQKAVLGRAMSRNPEMLVLINPTAGVDIASKETLFAAVRDRTQREGTTVLVVSDELDDLRGCDRVLVMFQGRIHAEFSKGWRDADVADASEGATS